MTPLVVLLTALVLGPVGAASAHTSLTGSNPADGATLLKAPRSLVLTFGEAVEVVPGGVRLLDESGTPQALSPAHHPTGRPDQVVVDLDQAVAPGGFVLDWRVVSDDGHPVEGASTFSVGTVDHSGAAAGPAVAATPGRTAVATGFARFVLLAGLTVLIGGLGLLWLCWPSGWSDRRARRTLVAGGVLVAVGSGAQLLLQGPYGAGLGLGAALDGDLLDASVRTRPGLLAAVRVVAALTAAALLARAPTSGRVGGLGRWGSLGAATVLVGATAASGHAGDGQDPVLATALDATHLVAASLWLGGLLMMLVGPLARGADRGRAGAVSTRYSRLAAACVLLIVTTGVVVGARRTGSWGALGQTTYGGVLLVKAGLLATILTFAAGARRVVQQRLGGDPGSVGQTLPLVPASTRGGVATLQRPARPGRKVVREQREADVRGLRQSVVVELTLGVVVLVATAVLVGLPPARAAYLPRTSVAVDAGPVPLVVTSTARGDHGLDVVVRASGGPAPEEVTATATFPDGAVGPIDLRLTSAGPGRWVAARRDLPIAGDWLVKVTVRTTDVDEFAAVTPATVR